MRVDTCPEASFPDGQWAGPLKGSSGGSVCREGEIKSETAQSALDSPLEVGLAVVVSSYLLQAHLVFSSSISLLLTALRPVLKLRQLPSSWLHSAHRAVNVLHQVWVLAVSAKQLPAYASVLSSALEKEPKVSTPASQTKTRLFGPV